MIKQFHQPKRQYLGYLFFFLILLSSIFLSSRRIIFTLDYTDKVCVPPLNYKIIINGRLRISDTLEPTPFTIFSVIKLPVLPGRVNLEIVVADEDGIEYKSQIHFFHILNRSYECGFVRKDSSNNHIFQEKVNIVLEEGVTPPF